MRWSDAWCTVRYIFSCLLHSLLKLWDLNPVSLVLRRWRQLHHMNTMMALSIRPRLIDLATDFFLSDDRRKRKLLSWVKSILPWVGDEVFDFTDCWQDGIVLCSVLEAINPGACPRFAQLKPHHRVHNCRLGLQLAMQYLQLTQLPLCPEEMAIADDRTEVKICHLVQLLKWKYQKQGSKPVFSIFSIDEPLHCKCQARGTGIRAGIVGRRAKFNILAEIATSLDLEIEIRGPNNEYNKEKIVSVDTGTRLPHRNQLAATAAAVPEDDGKSKIIDDGAGHSFLRQKTIEEDTGHVVIPFDYQCVGEGRFLVTYIPRNAGLHYITVLSGGVHIPGSPFEVKVSDWVSTWNLVPKSRVVPVDMLHSVEEKQSDAGDVDKDPQTKMKRQISQVAHMSQQLTRMKRRVLRKVITANGEEIICDVIPALTRQRSEDLLLTEEDRQQLEAIGQTDNEAALSSFKYLQNATVSDDDDDNNVSGNNNSKTERVTREEFPIWMLEQQVKNELMTPTIVTFDEACGDSDALDGNITAGMESSVLGITTDDLEDRVRPGTLEEAFSNKDRITCSSPTNTPPIGSNSRDTVHRSLDAVGITTDLEVQESQFPVTSYSLSTSAASSNRSSYSGGPSPVPQNIDIVDLLLDHPGLDKKECKPPATPNKIRSLSADETCLQRGLHFGNKNVELVIQAVLESSMSPKATHSFSVGENDRTVCQKNGLSCAEIVVLSSPSSNRHESLPGFSLLKISPSKEGCGECGSHEVTTHDRTNITHIFNSGSPTNDGLQSSLYCNAERNIGANGCSCCPESNLTDKFYTTRICGVVEKMSDISSLDNQTDVAEIGNRRNLNACNTRDDVVGKNHVCGDVFGASNASSDIKSEHRRAVSTTFCCDTCDFHSDGEAKSPLCKNVNAGQKLKKSWSYPHRGYHLDGKQRMEVSPHMTSSDSTIHLNKPELGLFSARSQTGSNSETSCWEKDANQYKIEILNSEGLSKPYFCFKDSLHCHDTTKKHASADSKRVVESQNENRGEQCLQNGKDGGTVYIRMSSGGRSPNPKTWNISDVDIISQLDEGNALSHFNETVCKELYSDEDEILHIVIVPKKNDSDNENDVSNILAHTTLSSQRNDHLPVLETHNECLSVSESTSPVPADDTYRLRREQVEEINGVSPFSDLSKISGNSDWSDIDDAARRFSENNKSTDTSSRYFLKGDWSPQFVELNYQGAVRSRRRSSARSMCSLSPSNCSHRTKHSITSLLDDGDIDTDRVKSSLQNERRMSDHSRDKDANENPVKVYSLSNNLSPKLADTAGTDLENRMGNGHNEIWEQCVGDNSDRCRPSTIAETTGPGGCKLYLRRRRKPVNISECPFGRCVGKEELTNTVKWQHIQNNMKPSFLPRPQEKTTGEPTSQHMPTVDTFFSKMELLSPALSDCLPVDSWSSLSNSWLNDLYKMSNYNSTNDRQWRDDSMLPHRLHQVPKCFIESFEERTLTPTKYREKKHVTRRAHGVQDHVDSCTVNSRFQDQQYGHQQKVQEVRANQSGVTGSGSTTQVVLAPGDKILTPTKYRLQKGPPAKRTDKSQMVIPREHDSKASLVPTKRCASDEAYEERNITKQVQKQGQTILQNTHNILDTMLASKPAKSRGLSNVSHLQRTQPRGSRTHKYSEMRRDLLVNRSHEDACLEHQDAIVRQPCPYDLCSENTQYRTEGNASTIKERKMDRPRKTTVAAEEITKHTRNITNDSENTNSHNGISCQFGLSHAGTSESDQVNGLHQQQRDHQKNLGQNPAYASHMCEIQRLSQFQTPACSYHGYLIHHQHQQQQQQFKNETSTHLSPLATLQRNADLAVGKLEYRELNRTQQEGIQHKNDDISMGKLEYRELDRPQQEGMQHKNDDISMGKLEYRELDRRQQEGMQHKNDDISMGKLEYRELNHPQQEGVQHKNDGLQDEQPEHTAEWQQELGEGPAAQTGSHRFGMRRQSTVETTDSGIVEGCSHYSPQLSHAERTDNSRLPGFGDEEFHLRLFLAVA